MTDRDDKASIIFPVVVGLCAWLVPGGGHFLLKETKRAIILFVAITILFVLGIYLGSIAVVDPVNEKLWYIPQMMVSPAVSLIGKATVAKGLESFGKPNEIGQVYTAIAGMLNLLCVIHAAFLAYCKTIRMELR